MNEIENITEDRAPLEEAPLVMRFVFPGGRYHATPWESHVNEGIVEWPPSPWRILRALLGVWHAKAKNDVSQALIEGLLEKLAASRPIYTLPRMAEAHTRHYMPLFKTGTSAKIFDAFAHVENGGRLSVSWPGVRMTAEERKALALLLARLAYLGRAESWVEATLVDEAGEGLQVVPDLGRPVEGAVDVLRYLVPISKAERKAWVEAKTEMRRRNLLEAKRRKALAKGKDVSKVRLTKGELAKCSAGLPMSILDVLEANTIVLKKEGWNRPPCTQWMTWLRPKDVRFQRRRIEGRKVRKWPTVARFALSSAVLPHITDVLSVCDRIHKTLVSLNPDLKIFRGRDDQGRPLQGHAHAFLFPDVARRQHITHVLVYASQGFDRHARLVLDKLGRKQVWSRVGHDIDLSLIDLGDGEELGGLAREQGEIALFHPSTTFRSFTPFVPVRHGKRRKNGEPKLNERGRQIDGPEDELVRRLREQGFPEPLSLRRIPSVMLGGKEIRWLSFYTLRRSDGPRRAAQAGVGFEITFPSVVQGPLAFGYGAHFGMGLFLPSEAFLTP